MGKNLFVDLSTGDICVDTPDEQLYRDFIGGYGLGARIIYTWGDGGALSGGPQARP
jgi:aldehyde:ferredoxin oxidoreductase